MEYFLEEEKHRNSDWDGDFNSKPMSSQNVPQDSLEEPLAHIFYDGPREAGVLKEHSSTRELAEGWDGTTSVEGKRK